MGRASKIFLATARHAPSIGASLALVVLLGNVATARADDAPKSESTAPPAAQSADVARHSGRSAHREQRRSAKAETKAKAQTNETVAAHTPSPVPANTAPSPVAADTATPPVAADPAAPPVATAFVAAPEVECRTMKATGSRIPKRVCSTAAAWADADALSKRNTDQMRQENTDRSLQAAPPTTSYITPVLQ